MSTHTKPARKVQRQTRKVLKLIRNPRITYAEVRAVVAAQAGSR